MFLRIASNKCPELFARATDYPYKMPQVNECEFFLLEMLVCKLLYEYSYNPHNVMYSVQL